MPFPRRGLFLSYRVGSFLTMAIGQRHRYMLRHVGVDNVLTRRLLGLVC